MHGMIFMELQKFVRSRLGDDAWPALLDAAGLKGKIYIGLSEYPDEEAVALVSKASAAAKLPVEGMLEEFGVFIAPEFLKIYQALVKPEWKTLDLIEHTEDTIHKVVRIQRKGAHPPALITRRVGPKEVVITYTSARRMCGIAKGIARGVATHYREKVQIAEGSCMNRGGTVCEISVRVV